MRNCDYTASQTIVKAKTLAAGTKRFYACTLSLLVLFLLPTPEKGASLGLSISPVTLNDSPGGTATFVGTVTNTTGISLNASDLFLNFSNYNLTAIVNIAQLLGVPDFAIPNNTFTAPANLFTSTLSSSAPSGTYSIDVSLEDINNNISNIVTVNLLIAGGTTGVPEASTPILTCIGLLLSFFARRYFVRSGNRV